ncbi:MAG: DASH family cryptochrome [Phaeodactylibacter sp.]|nr:DASH family cryptochrome [Phaeodactylibacter sp.]
MVRKRAILWFRLDLRLHDNEALQEALSCAHEVIPVYVFDERIFKGETRWYGFPKTGKYRAQFVLESVRELRENLRKLGSDLYVRFGKPEEEIFKIADSCKTSWVFCNRERTEEEVYVQDALEQKLWSIGQEIRYARGKMLYYTADLPFPVTHTPDVFTQFRKEVERIVQIRKPLPTPASSDFEALTCVLEPGDIPTLEDFGHEAFEPDPRSAFTFKGGEREGLRRLHYYLYESDGAATYKDTRNGLLGTDYSTKFSPWLSQGCLSPKKIYWELKQYEQERVKNKSTYWIFFELLWRDFFRLMGKKHGNLIFQRGGIQKDPISGLRDDFGLLNKWIEGKTGVPFIDANMREIKQTGFMSNRGRQNVASFLVKDLKVNWQMGAEYFESMLLDYDPCSNWGNWNYVAGVGSDPREDRYFNILTQAQKYDPQGTYVRTWVEELAEVPAELIHQPDLLSSDEQQTYDVKLGADYPMAMINTTRWARAR